MTNKFFSSFPILTASSMVASMSHKHRFLRSFLEDGPSGSRGYVGTTTTSLCSLVLWPHPHHVGVSSSVGVRHVRHNGGLTLRLVALGSDGLFSLVLVVLMTSRSRSTMTWCL